MQKKYKFNSLTESLPLGNPAIFWTHQGDKTARKQ